MPIDEWPSLAWAYLFGCLLRNRFWNTIVIVGVVMVHWISRKVLTATRVFCLYGRDSRFFHSFGMIVKAIERADGLGTMVMAAMSECALQFSSCFLVVQLFFLTISAHPFRLLYCSRCYSPGTMFKVSRKNSSSLWCSPDVVNLVGDFLKYHTWWTSRKDWGRNW